MGCSQWYWGSSPSTAKLITKDVRSELRNQYQECNTFYCEPHKNAIKQDFKKNLAIRSSMSLLQGLANFVKGQRGNIPGFGDHMVSVATTPFCHCSLGTAGDSRDRANTQGYGSAPTQLTFDTSQIQCQAVIFSSV